MSTAQSSKQVLRNNIIANGIGRLWALLASVIFVPVYISYLGSEAYGFIVFQITLLASLQVLDAGLTSALSRELALRLADQSPEHRRGGSVLNLVRTVEILSISTGALTGLALVLAAPLIATKWLKSGGLPTGEAVAAIRIMGAVIAVQWPSFAYQGALTGLQQQVKLNAIKVATSSLQAIGVVGVLAWVSATPRAYFLWVLLAQAINSIWLRHLVWRSLPAPPGAVPRFHWMEVTGVWHFAAGMAGITFLSAVLTQTDKIVLSKMVPLAEFGAYGVAFTVCSVLAMAANPVLTAAVPRFTVLIGASRTEELRNLYLTMCELVALMTVPAWTVLAFHAHQLMGLWMGQGKEADTIADLVQLLGAGSLANALVLLPYGLQIASGWTSLSVRKNVIAVALTIPALLFLVPRYGTVGAASIWFAINLGYVLFEIPIMHSRLLKGAALAWYTRAVCLPLLVAGGIGFASRALFSPAFGKLGMLLELVFWAAMTAVALVGVLPTIRRAVVRAMLARMASGWA